MLTKPVLKIMLLLLCMDLSAGLRLQVEKMQGDGWQLHQIALQWQASQLDLSIEQAQWADHIIQNIQAHCAELDLALKSCPQGQLQAQLPYLGAVKANINLQPPRYHLYLPYGEGQLKLRLEHDDVQAQLINWPLASLQSLLPAGWQLSGHLWAQLQTVLALNPLQLQGQISDLNYSDEAGLQVAEQGKLRYQIHKKGDDWQIHIEGLAGQWYSDPWFIELKEPLKIQLSLQAALPDWQGRLRIEYGDHHLQARFQGQEQRLLSLNLDLDSRALDRLYQDWVQPLLIGSPMDGLQVQGRIKAHIEIQAGQLSRLDFRLRQVSLEHELFSFSGLNAEVHWLPQAPVDRSYLSWQAGSIYNIALGQAQIQFKAAGDALDFSPFQIPLLNGRLLMQKLKIAGLSSKPHWQAQAQLKGLQLAELSRRLGWPEIQGQVDADLPDISYQDQSLQLNHPLKLSIFDGEIWIERLSLQEPLGLAPVLECDVRLKQLDLEQMTQVFDFGRIEGSLNGFIRGLQLIAWELNRFDAELITPKQDQRPHRISRKAVNHLTEIGNGVSFSNTMLGFFEGFAYDQIALKIHLRGNQAQLGGLPHKKGGFYIVKGKSLPRIDIIGVNRRIAWKELLSRLKQTQFDRMRIE